MKKTISTKTKEDKHSRILHAAMHIFMLRGYHLTTIDEIAVHANVAKGTVYLYYKSKSDILMACMHFHFKDMEQQLQHVGKLKGSAIEKLIKTIRIHLCDHMECQQATSFLFEILNSKSLAKELKLPALFKQWERAVVRIIGKIIMEGQRSGEIRPEISPRYFTYILFGAGDGIQFQRAIMNSSKRDMEARIRELENTIRFALKSPSHLKHAQ